MRRKPKDETQQLITWRNALEQTILNDDKWSAGVVIIEPAGSEQDHIYLENFEEFATKEKRFVIKNICKSELIFMINQLGSDNRSASEHNKIFEEAFSYIKEKTDIPSEVLALVIKHLILKMKEDDLFIKQQKLVVKDGITRESRTMINKNEVRGSVSVKPQAISPQSNEKRNSGVNETQDLDDEKKYNTLLRTRGEEWRDKAYVDDYPVDGPALYIIISNFQDPFLPTCLTRIMVPVNAVIQVRIELPLSIIPAGLIKPNKRGQVEVQSLHQEQALQFWTNLLWFRINDNTSESLKNTAFVIFSPPYWNRQKLSAEPEKIYDELSFLAYDIQDLSRQHDHFLKNIELIEIPTELNSECNIENYEERIMDLPFESVTIYSIIDSILHTVSQPDLKSDSSVESTSYNDNDTGGLELVIAVVNNVFKTLDENIEQKKHYRTTKGEELENIRDPIVINKGDIAKYTTFHLGNIGLNSIVESSLRYMPLQKLWINFDPLGEEYSAKISYHVNVLLSCFERKDIESTELSRLIHILACKKLYNNRSSLQEPLEVQSTISKFKKVYLKRSIIAEPIKRLSEFDTINSPTLPFIQQYENSSELLMCSLTSDFEVQRTKSLFNCPDISELVTPEEIDHELPSDHLIDDYIYFEDYRDTSAFQVLRHAYNTFNCINYKYCEVTDCIIMMFFNNFNEIGILREEWRCHIPTPVCLQDFFDFVLEEHYDWVQEEENKYNNETNIVSYSSKSILETAAIATCVTQEDVNVDMLMEGSLKFKEFVGIDDDSFNASNTSNVLKKKTDQNVSIFDITPKNLKVSKPSIGFESTSLLEPVKKPFAGYNLGDRRVEIFGKDSYYYGEDGSEIFTNYYLMIPNNYEWVTLKVVPGKSFNQIWIHRVLGDIISDKEREVSESFRISCKNGMLINCKKTFYEIPTPPQFESKIFFDINKHPSTPLFDNKTPVCEFYYSLNITWPNGLFTEIVHLDNSPTISHVKLTYLRPITSLNEEKRCISLNGEVIIFKSSGEIEILQPDSTYIKITKVDKIIKPNVVASSEEQISTSSLKKGKSKVESPKKLKPPIQEASVVNETYQFIIEDYKIICPNGDYENYIKNRYVGGERLLIRTATDYNLGEVFSRRLDGTNILINSEGLQIATFPNGTRIISKCVIEDEEIYLEWSDEDLMNMNSVNFNSANFSSFRPHKKFSEDELHMQTEGYISIQLVYTVEHKNFPTVTINNLKGLIKVDCPNGTSVYADFQNRYDMKLDKQTTAKFYGENLEVNYNLCPKCKYDTKFDIKILRNLDNFTDNPADIWMEMEDHLSNIIVVANEGGIKKKRFEESQVFEGENINCNYVSPPDSRASSSNLYDEKDNCDVLCKCKQTKLPNMRFFVMNRELNCSELVHRDMLAKTQNKYANNPAYSCNEYDTFGDYRTLLSLLTPINLNEKDKWLMESSLSDKPQNLSFKDLKVDEGKGFYHWMRPYERFEPKPRKPPSVLPLLPRAYKLRTLETQFTKKKFIELKGAKELIKAILKYRQVMAVESETIMNVPIIDNRSQKHIKVDNTVQKIAKWVYEDLKHGLTDAAEKRAKLGITTRPIPNIHGEVLADDEASEQLYPLMVNDKDVLSDLDVVVPMSPSLKRYWSRRKKEYRNELFYQYLLRECIVPPYFINIIGGAVWWDVNNLVDKAVTKSIRKNTMCVCDEKTFKNCASSSEEKNSKEDVADEEKTSKD